MALMPDPKSPLLHTSRHLKVSRSFQKPTATQAVPEHFLDPPTLLQNSIRTTIHCIDSFGPGRRCRTLTLLASNLRWQAGTHNSGAILHTEWRKSESLCRTHAMRPQAGWDITGCDSPHQHRVSTALRQTKAWGDAELWSRNNATFTHQECKKMI